MASLSGSKLDDCRFDSDQGYQIKRKRMTHLWKTSETWSFDIPSKHRLVDVYWKNTHWLLKIYLQLHGNTKVTEVRFDATRLGVHVEIAHPKYPEERPYFTDGDVSKLLKTYMNYANATHEEMMEWWMSLKKKEDTTGE